MQDKRKAFFYIDGFALYYGLKSKGWKKYYWLNLEALCERLIPQHLNQSLEQIKYFTAKVLPANSQKARRQDKYLQAIGSLDKVKIIEGIYHSHPSKPCPRCNKTFKCACKSNNEHIKTEEKKTDVNIVVNMLCDAFLGEYEVAYLISADSDLVPAIERLKIHFPQKRIIVCFPPDRFSSELQQVCHVDKTIHDKYLAKSQFKQQVINKKGYVIERPIEWC